MDGRIVMQPPWHLALRGGLAILFGVLAIAWPGLTLLALVYLFGAYAIVDGISELVVAVRGKSGLVEVSGADRGWLALLGVVGVAAGIVAFAWPGITGLVLLVVIGVWALVVGLVEIVAAFRMRHDTTGEWLRAIAGALSIIFGIAVLFQPGTGALALAWLIGTYAILLGATFVVVSVRLRALQHGAGGMAPQPG